MSDHRMRGLSSTRGEILSQEIDDVLNNNLGAGRDSYNRKYV